LYRMVQAWLFPVLGLLKTESVFFPPSSEISTFQFTSIFALPLSPRALLQHRALVPGYPLRFLSLLIVLPSFLISGDFLPHVVFLFLEGGMFPSDLVVSFFSATSPFPGIIFHGPPHPSPPRFSFFSPLTLRFPFNTGTPRACFPFLQSGLFCCSSFDLRSLHCSPRPLP